MNMFVFFFFKRVSPLPNSMWSASSSGHSLGFILQAHKGFACCQIKPPSTQILIIQPPNIRDGVNLQNCLSLSPLGAPWVISKLSGLLKLSVIRCRTWPGGFGESLALTLWLRNWTANKKNKAGKLLGFIVIDADRSPGSLSSRTEHMEAVRVDEIVSDKHRTWERETCKKPRAAQKPTHKPYPSMTHYTLMIFPFGLKL